jgi:hypothetical protein
MQAQCRRTKLTSSIVLQMSFCEVNKKKMLRACVHRACVHVTSYCTQLSDAQHLATPCWRRSAASQCTTWCWCTLSVKTPEQRRMAL